MNQLSVFLSYQVKHVTKLRPVPKETRHILKLTVFQGPNTGKYGPEKTLYLDTFHAAQYLLYLFKTPFPIPFTALT